jgi:hypothetical protein
LWVAKTYSIASESAQPIDANNSKSPEFLITICSPSRFRSSHRLPLEIRFLRFLTTATPIAHVASSVKNGIAFYPHLLLESGYRWSRPPRFLRCPGMVSERRRIRIRGGAKTFQRRHADGQWNKLELQKGFTPPYPGKWKPPRHSLRTAL